MFSGRGRTTRHQDRSGLGHWFRAQRSAGAEWQIPGWEGCEPERALSHGGSLPTGKAKPLGLLLGVHGLPRLGAGRQQGPAARCPRGGAAAPGRCAARTLCPSSNPFPCENLTQAERGLSRHLEQGCHITTSPAQSSALVSVQLAPRSGPAPLSGDGGAHTLPGAPGHPSDLLHAKSLPGAIWAPPDSKP